MKTKRSINLTGPEALTVVQEAIDLHSSFEAHAEKLRQDTTDQMAALLEWRNKEMLKVLEKLVKTKPMIDGLEPGEQFVASLWRLDTSRWEHGLAFLDEDDHLSEDEGWLPVSQLLGGGFKQG